MIRKILTIICCFFVMFSSVGINGTKNFSVGIVNADTLLNGVIVGDLNSDNFVTAVDLVFLRRYLLGKCPIEIVFDAADISLNNQIDIRDLIGLKKHLSSNDEKIHSNRQENTMVWVVANDTELVPVLTTLAFNVISVCRVTTYDIGNRGVSEVTAFAKTEKQPSPLFAQPSLSIGTTTIENKEVTMRVSSDVFWQASWIWTYRVGYFGQSVQSENSNFDCLIIGMNDEALVAYQSAHNNFVF